MSDPRKYPRCTRGKIRVAPFFGTPRRLGRQGENRKAGDHGWGAIGRTDDRHHSSSFPRRYRRRIECTTTMSLSLTPSRQAKEPDGTPIVFYDGECGLCSRLVVWCLRHDRWGVLRFAPLRGATYANLKASTKPEDASTIVLSDASGIHIRSAAVWRILRYLGGGWSWLGAVGALIPTAIGDAAYRFVARRRRRWFKPADSCALPDPEHSNRFLP